MTTSPTHSTNRTSKFRRQPETVPAIAKWNERDDALLEALALHRFATSDDLHRIVGGSKQGLTRRLQQLFHHGYLDRPPQQLAFWKHGSHPMIYALGDQGATYLRGTKGLDLVGKNRPRYWHDRNMDVSAAHMHHTVTITSLYSMLKSESEARDVAFSWTPEGAELRDNVYVPRQGKRAHITINPDGFAHFRWQIPGKKRNRWAFIEVDTGTEPNERSKGYGTDIATKLRGFWQWGYIEKRHKQRFSIPGFLVIFATTGGDRRVDNILATARSIDPKKVGSSMFWAGHFDKDTQPADLFDAIWKTPDGKPHSLLE